MKSAFYGAFVWARTALNGSKRWFPARAVSCYAGIKGAVGSFTGLGQVCADLEQLPLIRG
jgi:hypothetical protein